MLEVEVRREDDSWRTLEWWLLMKMSSALGAWLLSASLLNAGTPEGLTYRIRLQLQGDAEPLEGRFRLVPTPVLRTHNRVKPLRMGGWRLEPLSGTLRGVMARAERMLYLAGPSPETNPRHAAIRYGNHLCSVWDVRVPPGGGVYAYLVEVKPGILALSYLSGRFAGGDLRSVELQLEKVHLPRCTAPAEDGTALLTTLARLTAAPTLETSDMDGVTFLDERVERR